MTKKSLSPRRASLGITTVCQLNCVDCYMRKNGERAEKLGTGHLTPAAFTQFLDTNPTIKRLEICHSGEIFLNPHLLEILKIAHQRGLTLTAGHGTNFNTVTDEILEGLVKYRLQLLFIALDGASQATYQLYRRGGDFKQVIKNIRRLNYYKQKYHSATPYLRWQYVIFAHNDSLEEIRAAKKLAAQLDMKITFQRAWNGHVPQNLALIQQETGLQYIENEDPMRHLFSTVKNRYLPCFLLWSRPQINWDGEFLGCSSNISRQFGLNVFESNLETVLNSPIVLKTKKMLMGGPLCKSPCLRCQHFRHLLKDKKFITAAEINAFTAHEERKSDD